jgi:hypothetical protein
MNTTHRPHMSFDAVRPMRLPFSHFIVKHLHLKHWKHAGEPQHVSGHDN